MAAEIPKYPYNIQNLEDVPPLPPLLGLDINRPIQVNTPINSSNLRDAKSVAKILRATLESSSNHGVTEDIVERAELRARAVENAHVAAIYSPAPAEGMAAIMEQLNALRTQLNTIDGRFATMQDSLDELKAQSKIHTAMQENYKIVQQNLRNKYILTALRKTIPGHGFERARQLIPKNQRHHLVEPVQPDAIGQQPFEGARDISDYNNVDVCKLIIFYNHDFGIVDADDIKARRIKLMNFWQCF